jgi:aspartate/tyrosine/aromatic aminotransferase
LGTALAFKADTDPKKVNLGVGAYRTDDSKPYVFECIKRAELELAKELNEGKIDKEYLGVDGLAEYNKLC